MSDLDLSGSTTVVELARPLLDDGRLVVNDNYSTSIELVKYLHNVTDRFVMNNTTKQERFPNR